MQINSSCRPCQNSLGWTDVQDQGRSRMRSFVEPLPAVRCKHCDGELRFKKIEPCSSAQDIDIEIFVCAKCARELSRAVSRDKYAAGSRNNNSTIHAFQRNK